MKKQLMIFGIILVFLVSGLSGCEQKPKPTEQTFTLLIGEKYTITGLSGSSAARNGWYVVLNKIDRISNTGSLGIYDTVHNNPVDSFTFSSWNTTYTGLLELSFLEFDFTDPINWTASFKIYYST